MPDMQKNITLYDRLISRNISSNRTAIHFEGCKYTYGDLHSLTSRACSFLREKGIKEGDVALLSMFDSADLIVALLSCIRMGVTVGIVDPMSGESNRKTILDDIRPKYVISEPFLSMIKEI